MGQRCDCRMATTSLTWCPVYLLEVSYVSSLFPLSGHFMYGPLLTSPVSGACIFRSSNGDLGQEFFELEFALFSKQDLSL